MEARGTDRGAPLSARRVVSVAIDSIAAGGDGVGRTAGLVVFVPRTAPGDVVTATVSGGRHFARGALHSVVQPSPERVDPPCPHYTRDRCGGCQIQHVTYTSQLAAKQRIIVDAMQRIGKRTVAPPRVHGSPSQWRYRTKLTLALRRGAGGQWIAGLHPYDDPSHVFPLADCPITDRRVVAVWREIMDAAALLPAESTLRGSVRWTDDGATFVLQGGRRWSDHAAFLAAAPSIAALWWEPEERPRVALHDRRRTRTPAASFAQVNAEMAAELRAHVLTRVAAHSPRSVVDAYSGAGDLASCIAELGVAVTAIELDGEASAWAEARLPGGSRAVRGKVEEVLPRALPADVVVLNPPRGGVHAAVAETLATTPQRPAIIYVSCDPATLARDVSRLTGYRIAGLTAFDMFPQTAHVETVCELVPEAA